MVCCRMDGFLGREIFSGGAMIVLLEELGCARSAGSCCISSDILVEIVSYGVYSRSLRRDRDELRGLP